MHFKIFYLIIISFVTFSLLFTFFSIRDYNGTQSTKYTLKESNGLIALYQGDKKLKTYTQIVVDVLPEYDRNLLKRGINITSKEQLISIIEDYE